MTFGSREEASRECEVVKVCLVIRGGGIRQLTLFVVPYICKPLMCHPASFCHDNYKRSAGLPLADPSDVQDHLEVNILIGSNQYWSLLTGKTRRWEGSSVAVQTELRWVISGPVGIPTQEQGQITLVTYTLHIESLLQ